MTRHTLRLRKRKNSSFSFHLCLKLTWKKYLILELGVIKLFINVLFGNCRRKKQLCVSECTCDALKGLKNILKFLNNPYKKFYEHLKLVIFLKMRRGSLNNLNLAI